MTSNWYVLYIRPVDREGKPLPLAFPLVGRRIVHYLGRSDDQEQLDRDRKNPMWNRIQDGVRPAWAPDLLRLGYAVVFKRDGLPKLAVKLGIKNPDKLRAAGGGSSGGKRVLTFDDVWVVGVEPQFSPIGMPTTDQSPEDWWLAVPQVRGDASPYAAPGGGEVMTGAQRLSDVVSAYLKTPNGLPRVVPTVQQVEDENPWQEFQNPLVPALPRVSDELSYARNQAGSQSYYTSLRLFRY